VPLIGLDIVAGLEGAGVKVEGPVGSVEEALRVIENASLGTAGCQFAGPTCGTALTFEESAIGLRPCNTCPFGGGNA
jgi:hypothetical protein